MNGPENKEDKILPKENRMETVIDFTTQAELVKQKKFVKRFIEYLKIQYDHADAVQEEFAQLVVEDEGMAIKRLPEFLVRCRGTSRQVECLGGGPNPDWVVPILNVLGSGYSEMLPETRKAFLDHCLHYFDTINNVYVQNHVDKLQDPLLITDICYNRRLYWPGIEDAQKLLVRCSTPDLLSQEPETVVQTFWVALAVLWNARNEGERTATLPLRQWYYGRYRALVERTLVYPAMIVSESATLRQKKGEGSFEDCLRGSLARNFDVYWHEHIRVFVNEAPWIKL